MRLWIAAGSALLAALLSQGAQATGAETCAAIPAATDRLACYDALFQVTADADPARTGKWTLRTGVSPMTDQPTVFLSLDSENAIPAPEGRFGPGVLRLRCQENTTAAFMTFNDHLMADAEGHGRVEYRIDDRPMNRVEMDANANALSLGLWNGRRSIPWITSLLGHDRLVVRATPPGESALTLTFDIGGLDAAIVDLRDTCGW